MTYKEPIRGVLQITQFLIKNFQFDNILDVGCGYAPYVNIFTNNNKDYTGIDFNIDNKNKKKCSFIKSDFMKHDFKDKKFDCVYTSHCIEHIPDTETFLKRLRFLIKDDGILCIIFPKPKDEIVGGHVHIFNPGIMLYNLVRIGINCKHVQCLDCGYSYAVVGKIKKEKEKKLIKKKKISTQN
jgi:ubiquinone/menaquinone biosynthesis C-methylase UbiE